MRVPAKAERRDMALGVRADVRRPGQPCGARVASAQAATASASRRSISHPGGRQSTRLHAIRFNGCSSSAGMNSGARSFAFVSFSRTNSRSSRDAGFRTALALFGMASNVAVAVGA